MSEKRRDNKGRLLRTGESQRADGKYEYKYVDAKGVRRSLYSWRLVSTDKLPPKKRACEALRDMEAKVLRDTQDGINSFVAARMTLTLSEQRATRFFRTSSAAGGVILVAGRQPGCLVCLASR